MTPNAVSGTSVVMCFKRTSTPMWKEYQKGAHRSRFVASIEASVARPSDGGCRASPHTSCGELLGIEFVSSFPRDLVSSNDGFDFYHARLVSVVVVAVH